MTTAAFDAHLDRLRGEVESYLDRSLPAAPDCPAVLAEAMRYSVTAGGKRLRPVLTLSAAEAVAAARGGDPAAARAAALPAAAAIELIHTYSLIHDDLPSMDDDTLRRGRPTLHVVHGEGMAVLAGDALHSHAFALLAGGPEPDPPALAARRLRVVALVARAAGPAGMAGGQAIDLSAVTPGPDGRLPPALDAAGLEAMHARKTGALIRAAVVAGAIMGGGDEPAIHAAGQYAAEIGLAFQIVDDILDVEAGSDALGKTAGKDEAAGKPTYPALFGLEPSREMAAACVARAEAALAAAGLRGGHLDAIARWVIERRS
ncbi:MAG: polyprenyl synthetase family protein [Vicinamibacterales bacterium]